MQSCVRIMFTWEGELKPWSVHIHFISYVHRFCHITVGHDTCQTKLKQTRKIQNNTNTKGKQMSTACSPQLNTVVVALTVLTALTAVPISLCTGTFNKQKIPIKKRTLPSKTRSFYCILFVPFPPIKKRVCCLANVFIAAAIQPTSTHTNHPVLLLIGSKSSDNNIKYLNQYKRWSVFMNIFHDS
jgi:hypothetical protein